MDRQLVAFGSFFALAGVALGAFGSHGLKDRLSQSSLEIWKTGVQYHQLHAVAAVLAGLIVAHTSSSLARKAGWAFLVGICLFAGSLYALALSQIKWLGAITPLGGVAFMAGWVMLAISVSTKESRKSS